MSLFPKSRVDALTDGVFAFAMTLLVLDIRLPDDLPISSAADLWAHLASLWHQMLAYLISFFVLGAFWRGNVELRPSAETVSGRVVELSLLLLLFVTLVPFSSGLVSRYDDFVPAVVVYAGNMIGLAALTAALRHQDVPREKRSLRAAFGTKLPLLLISALVSVGMSLISPKHAMLAYLLNVLDGGLFFGNATDGKARGKGPARDAPRGPPAP